MTNLDSEHKNINKPKRFFIYLPIILALVFITGIYVGKRLIPGISLDKSLLNIKPHSKYNKLWSSLFGYYCSRKFW